MTNTPPEQVPTARRYKIGYTSDSWGERSSTPSGIPCPTGAWVRYEDHAAVIAALRAQQDDAYDHGPQAETVEEAARDVGKWLNERPNRPLDLRHVAMLTHHAKRTAHVQNPAEIEHVAGDVSKNGAEVNTSTQQPAPAGATPMPLLVRDVAANFGVTPVQVCLALVELGFGHLSVNMAITPKMAEQLREHFAVTPQPAPATPITVEQVEDAIGLQSSAWYTIGAEKIVEAVLRLANAAPATQQAGDEE